MGTSTGLSTSASPGLGGVGLLGSSIIGKKIAAGKSGGVGDAPTGAVLIPLSGSIDIADLRKAPDPVVKAQVVAEGDGDQEKCTDGKIDQQDYVDPDSIGFLYRVK